MSKLNRRCIGINKNLNRCGRSGNWFLLCHEHKRQPVIWGFILTFSIGSGIASIYSVFQDRRQADVSHQQSTKRERGNLPFSLSGVVDSENRIAFGVASDVALIAIFDPVALKHRFRDDKNWWVESSELVREMNRGNGIFLSTGYDGFFEVLIHGGSNKRIRSSAISMNFVCEGGVIYVGGYPSDGIAQIDSPFGADYLSCEIGAYEVEIRRESGVIDLSFSQIEWFSRNNFEEIPHFDDFYQ